MRHVKTRMMEIGANSRGKGSLAQEYAAALEWWRDAGVDCAFGDEPVDWLASAAAPEAAVPGKPANPRPVRPPPPPLPPVASPAFDPAALPGDLAAFAAWWLAEPTLDEGRVAGRVAPRGAAGADVMVMVPHPEKDDGERLLGGPQGRLLDAVLSGFGIPAERAYVASALPRHTPMADWPGIAARGMGAVLRHHVALVAPARLIVFGGNILPLLGNTPAQGAAVLQQFNHEGRSMPLLAAWELQTLLNAPRNKAALWGAWLDWTGTSSERKNPVVAVARADGPGIEAT